MKYKSEAQAFQAIRKEYKRRRNEAQRQQNHYDWSAKHGGQRHPYLLKMVSKIMKNHQYISPIKRPSFRPR